MTLAQRTLLGVALLVLLVAGSLGIAVHQAWTAQTVSQFYNALEETSQRLREQLDREATILPSQLRPLCEHSQLVDSALTDLVRTRGHLPTDRQLALKVLLPETKKAYGFDELILVADQSLVIGGGSLSAERRRQLLALRQAAATARIQPSGSPLLQAHCSRSRAGHRITLIASRKLIELVDTISAAHGIRLTDAPPDDQNALAKPVTLEVFGGQTMHAQPASNRLTDALEQLTLTVLAYSALVLGFGLLLGWLFARRLSQPIVKLAKAATQSVTSDDLPGVRVEASGTTELRLLAFSFNSALSALQRLKKRLELTERIAAQREIARRVAHEIKNPLAPIRAAVETLRRLHRRQDPAFEEYFEEASRTVLDEVRRINAIVQEFTEFARLPSPKPTTFTLQSLLEDIVRAHNAAGPKVQIRPFTDFQVNADRDQIVQVLTNLIQNAQHATSKTNHPEIHLQVSDLSDRYSVDVVDNGRGVPEKLRDKLFTPYFTTKDSGTGLGLAIAQTIVVEHGGEITFAANAPTGSTFSVSLPASLQQQDT